MKQFTSSRSVLRLTILVYKDHSINYFSTNHRSLFMIEINDITVALKFDLVKDSYFKDILK